MALESARVVATSAIDAAVHTTRRIVFSRAQSLSGHVRDVGGVIDDPAARAPLDCLTKRRRQRRLFHRVRLDQHVHRLDGGQDRGRVRPGETSPDS